MAFYLRSTAIAKFRLCSKARKNIKPGKKQKDEATNKHKEARGQLHAILRCANKGIDDVFFKHYGLRVTF